MKSDCMRPEVLEAHYGSAVPTKPLQALQRDRLLTNSTVNTDDVYEGPMAEVSGTVDTLFTFNIWDDGHYSFFSNET